MISPAVIADSVECKGPAVPEGLVYSGGLSAESKEGSHSAATWHHDPKSRARLKRENVDGEVLCGEAP